MYELSIIMTFTLCILYIITAFFVLKEKRSLANLLFGISVVFLLISHVFALIGYLAADGYILLNKELFWELGTIFLLLSPSGFFFSARIINYGEIIFSRIGSAIWIIFSFFIVLGVLIIYPIQTEIENIQIWDPILVILILGATWEYYRLYTYKPTWQTKVSLIIIGFVIAMGGLGLNSVIVFITNESSDFIRHIPPVIGLMMVIGAYLIVPVTQREIKDWNQLNLQNKEMELLIDLLTHDLANHLTISQGFLEEYMLTTNSDEHFMLLNKSKSGQLRAEKLLKTVSIFMKSKLDYTYHLRPISIKEAITDSEEILKEIFPNKKIEIISSEINEEDRVLADSFFNHLLLNLMTNSVKNDSNDIIKIEITKKLLPTNKYQIQFKDYGKGIHPKDRQGIFGRYNQFRSEGKGSGLGLFIVKTLMNRYNGEISISNTNPNDYTHGTTFLLNLPKA